MQSRKFSALCLAALAFCTSLSAEESQSNVNRKGCGDWFFSAEALYFKAQEDGLAYGTKVEGTTIPGGTLEDIEVLNPKTRWDWGFRLGLGYDFNCGWDLRAYWTNFRTEGHGHATEDAFLVGSSEVAVGSLFTTWGSNFGPGGNITGPAIDRLDAHWRLRLDLVDVELGKDFCLNSCLSLRPHIGIRAARIHQKYHVEAEAATLVGATIFRDTKIDSLRTNFEGVGVRTGLDANWNLGCGFGIYGKAAAALVYGHFHNRIIEEVDITAPTGANQILDPDFIFAEKDSYHACRLMADAALGISYQQAFCCDTVLLTLTFGWEQHIFVDQNRFEDFANNDVTVGSIIGGNSVNTKNPQRGRGDLCIRGWTFGAMVDF